MGIVVEFKRKPKEVNKDELDPSSDTKESFEEIAERNKRNADRIKQERLQQNKQVLRDYRIK